MEPVAKLSVDVGLSSDHKGEIGSAPTKKIKPQEGFSKVLTRHLSDNKKSGKEATQDGKKIAKKATNEALKKLTGSAMEKNEKENSEANNVNVDKKNSSTAKTMIDQAVEIKQKKSTKQDDPTDQPEQLISLLQTSENTLTSTKLSPKATPEISLKTIAVQDGSKDSQSKNNTKIDLASHLKGDETLLADKKSANKLTTLAAGIDDAEGKIQAVNSELAAKELKVKQTTGKTSSEQANIDKKIIKNTKSTDAKTLTNLNKEKIQHNNQQKISESIVKTADGQKDTTSTTITDAKIDLRQLTAEQLQKMALLRNTSNKNHEKGQTPPIIIKPPVLPSLQDNTKLTTKKGEKLKIEEVPLIGESTPIKDKKQDKGQTPPIIIKPPVLTSLQDNTKLTTKKGEKLKFEEVTLLEKNASIKAKNEADILKSATLIKKKLAPINTPLSTTGSVDNSTTNITDGIDNKLRDIQSLQVVSQKIVDNNVQTQKVDLSNQIQTININRKDFVSTLQDKVMVMVQQKINQVDIRLDPPELGHMHVRLHLHNEQANVQFMVQNQQAKEVLDQNMPRLKEMLAQQGVNVGDANVGHQNQQSSTGTMQGNEMYPKANMSEDDYFEENNQVFSVNSLKGSALGVDYYA